ncbi:uncharacterized protein LOC113869162 [Abrus precatorius]|uniref:Uncharacterized protein LOC113869162 n=1 Tax=Abrus precatorius TaxID=3816 RepID=A0A8B8M1R2_ABRPR|nr:uncharacterized protein LOC113869162 [Abrus precatorius]XP_027361144.1 uncharacterized protein LOC113869162 [Abrus precatorius]
MKMNTAQVTACQTAICVKNIYQVHRLHLKPCVLPKSIDPYTRVVLSLRGEQSFGLKCRPVSQARKPLYICLAGEKEMMGNSDENSPWKSIEKAMEKFKGQSIEDVLRKQIEKGEYYDSGGGSGVKPPGGGGGSGGSPDDSDGSEDESLSGMWEENVQALLAAFGFIFLYIYILTGEEITKLARDYIKYLFGGSPSIRLKNAMAKWQEIYELFTTKEEEEDEYWLEKTILNTRTWFDDPAYYRETVRNYLKSHPEAVVAIRDEFDLDSDEEVLECLESDSDSDSDSESDEE